MIEEKMRYSDADLAEFREIIVNKMEKLPKLASYEKM